VLFAVWRYHLAVRSALYIRIHWMGILTYIPTHFTVLYYITRSPDNVVGLNVNYIKGEISANLGTAAWRRR